jgi:flagellar biosynthesis component FlhA
MNKNYIIGGALIVGGGLYYAYTKGLLDKFIKPKTPEDAKQESQSAIDEIKQEQKAVVKDNVKKAVSAAIIKSATTSLANPNSIDSKVKKLQTLLKVGTDVKTYMNPNSATNKALAATYGLDKGVVSATNVDYYIAKVTSNNTLVAQKLAALKQQKVQSQTINDAKKFLDLVNNKGFKATLMKDVSSRTLIFDSLKNTYADTNEPKSFSKGTKFFKGNFSAQPRGGYVLFIGFDKKRIPLNPSDFIVTQ